MWYCACALKLKQLFLSTTSMVALITCGSWWFAIDFYSVSRPERAPVAGVMLHTMRLVHLSPEAALLTPSACLQ